MIGEGRMREEFKEFLLLWTGRDMEQHERAGTTGLDFAWECWRKAAATAELRAIRDANPWIAEVAK